MSKLFNDAGQVKVINSDASRGAQVTFEGWPSGGYLVDKIDDEYKELRNNVKCFGEHSHTYAFGADTARIGITLLVPGNLCGGNAGTLPEMIAAYKKGRLYTAKGARANLTDGGVAHSGNIVKLTVGVSDKVLNIYSVKLELEDPPLSGGGGDEGGDDNSFSTASTSGLGANISGFASAGRSIG